ncbi:putative pilus biogenesis operon protein [Corallococcus coralloides DSM 2259]|uniref:Putative pilus biogenesis operon protein n=1 Tax=Corallococcus coralloides (strain ATCC 25202 / DSM 2259 / NBRC 100086 / M2) TaxID=1144275 RepID=H8MRR0_CORCM|nr:pilus assembly protein TadG-related protein [Corallococcus coralloides]AFE07655.1 putative pilus biogenesis operon protein [Corallococcus coralloides DSM 2259]
MRRSFSQRGQTLVLFVLSMLLLLLMVALTLSFTMKVRERIEVQTVADAAAYSNAVATARTFNTIAVSNRAEIAHMVANAGAASLLSWASLYRGELNAAKIGYGAWLPVYQAFATAGCPCAWSNGFCARMCQCGVRGVTDLGRLITTLQREDLRVEAVFQALDPMVGLQMRLHQVAAGALYASSLEDYMSLEDKVGDQGFANDILGDLVAGKNPRDAGWLAPSAGNVSRNELADNTACVGGGAVCDPLPLTVAHSVDAAMGSRGFTFVTSRTIEQYIAHEANLAFVILPPDIVTLPFAAGTAHFGKPILQYGLFPPYAPAVSAEDEGVVAFIYNHIAHGGGPPCPVMVGGTVPTTALFAASGGVMPTPMHMWLGGTDPAPFARHMLAPCLGGVSSCPGIWPPFMDYNLTELWPGGADNNYGQPKNFAVIQRDRSNMPVAQQDPWNLAFRFRFKAANPNPNAGRFDNTSATMADGVTPLGIQTALSTGIAYYHRGRSASFSHWSEPPNLLNPYWRATLVPVDTDETGLQDAIDTLRPTSPSSAQTIEELRRVGFRGFQ